MCVCVRFFFCLNYCFKSGVLLWPTMSSGQWDYNQPHMAARVQLNPPSQIDMTAAQVCFWSGLVPPRHAATNFHLWHHIVEYCGDFMALIHVRKTRTDAATSLCDGSIVCVCIINFNGFRVQANIYIYVCINRPFLGRWKHRLTGSPFK